MEYLSHLNYQLVICLMGALTSLAFSGRLTRVEKWVVVIMVLNMLTDVAGHIMWMNKINNGDLYNVLGPVEKVITLGIYTATVQKNAMKKYNVFGMIVIVLLSVYGFLKNGITGVGHLDVYIISGFIIAILTYLHLRSMILHGQSKLGVIFWFCVANLIYYTVMISSNSALPLASTISKEFALQVYQGNGIAYSLWTIIITIGIIWNRTKN